MLNTLACDFNAYLYVAVCICKYEWCIHIYYINVTLVPIEHYSYLNFMHVLSSQLTSAIKGKERKNKFGKTGTTSSGNVNLQQLWSKLNDQSSFLCMGPGRIQAVSVRMWAHSQSTSSPREAGQRGSPLLSSQEQSHSAWVETQLQLSVANAHSNAKLWGAEMSFSS